MKKTPISYAAQIGWHMADGVLKIRNEHHEPTDEELVELIALDAACHALYNFHRYVPGEQTIREIKTEAVKHFKTRFKS